MSRADAAPASPLVPPHALVPELTGALATIATHGLARPVTDGATGPLPPEAWRLLTGLLDEQRLWGLAAASVAAGRLVVGPEQAEQVAVRHEEAMLACLRLDRLLLRVDRALAAAGIDRRVLKGVASASRLYPERSWRSYGDLDLLVAGERFDRAAAVLVALGGARHNPDARPGFVARFGKSATFTVDGLEVDLHRTFHLGPFGLVAGRHDLLASRDEIDVGGRPVPILGPEAMLIAAAFHAVLPRDERRLVPLRDVAQLLGPARVDAVAAVTLAARWGVSVVLAAAIQEAVRIYALPASGPLAGWAADYRPDARERRWLARSHDRRADTYLRGWGDELVAVGRWPDRVAFVRATVWHEGAEPWPARAARLARTISARRTPGP